MHSTLGQSLLAATLILSTITLGSLLVVSQTKTQAEVEPIGLPSVTAVELAHDQVKAGNVWDGAATTLAEIRSLPATAEAIDQALPLMQLLAFTMSSLMQDEELKAFVDQLDPIAYPQDYLILMSFYHEFRVWEVGRKMSFISEDNYWVLVDKLMLDENALVRMAALLFKAYQKKDLSKAEGRSLAVEIINSMAEECPECRVTREMFRVLLRETMWRTTDDTEAVAEDVYPEAIADLLLNSPWNDRVSTLMANDGVVQTIFSIFNSPAVSAAGSKEEALAALITEAIAASESNPDPEVRTWLRATLSPCVATGKSYSEHSKQVRTAMTSMATAALNAPEKMPLDASRSQYVLLIKSSSLRDGPVDEATLDSLLNQKREQEPVGINFFARIPTEVSYYAHSQINKRDYAGAVAVFQKLIDRYPNSDLARRSQETVNALLPLCK